MWPYMGICLHMYDCVASQEGQEYSEQNVGGGSGVFEGGGHLQPCRRVL